MADEKQSKLNRYSRRGVLKKATIGSAIGASLVAGTRPVAALDWEGESWSEWDGSYGQWEYGASPGVYDCFKIRWYVSYQGYHVSTDDVRHKFVFASVGHSYDGEKNARHLPVYVAAPAYAQDACRTEWRKYDDIEVLGSFDKTFPGYANERTENTWSDIVKSKGNSMDEYEKAVQGQLSDYENRKSKELLAYIAGKVMAAATSVSGVSDAYSIARALFSENNRDWCGEERLNNPGGVLFDPCVGRVPLLFQHVDREFQVPRDSSNHYLKLRQAAQIQSDHRLDRIGCENVKDWGLRLPGSAEEASIWDAGTQKKKEYYDD